MTDSDPGRRATRRILGILGAGLLVVIAAMAPALAHQPMAPSSTTALPPIDFLRREHPGAPGAIDGVIPDDATAPPRVHRGPLRGADGVVPDATTVFDDEVPGVANLDPALLGALREAATDATDDGVEFFVESGWRSLEYQEQLLREAIAAYGSAKEAARWVATPKTSPHVSGDAVDVGPVDATAWLSRHGAEYGLCRIYRNEPWHFELRPSAIDHGCPPMYADPAHDPRMQH